MFGTAEPLLIRIRFVRKSLPLTGAVVGLSLLASVAAAADFVVINTGPSGPGSLYQAITDANAQPGADRILFNIPGAGVHKIDVSQTPLPTVLESLIIDGYSQPGTKPNSSAVGNNAVILIQIDGSGASATTPVTSLSLGRGYNQNLPLAADYTIRGLSLTGSGQGTAVSAAGDTAIIAGNFIGVLPDGQTAGANYLGIDAHPATVVGGTDPASRNVISGNTGYGWYGTGVVLGNYIGTDATGTKAKPNGTGLWYVGSDARFGGTEPGAGNLISGNDTAIKVGGDYYTYYPYPHNDYYLGNNARIQGNLIGVAADGSSPLPNNNGISLRHGQNNVIGGTEPGSGNIIAFNGSGVDVSYSYSFCAACGTTGPPPSEGNEILGNSIYANAGLAVDLGTDGSTGNDANDPDSGPNTFQNAPVITSTQIANGSATITATFNSTPNTQFAFQFFSESLDLVRPIQTYLGSVGVSTDASGNAQVVAVFPVSDTNLSFNATATSAANNTSEFARHTGKLENISTRVLVQTGDNAAIAGLILPRNSYLAFRALGPSLKQSHHLTGVLADPVIEVRDSTGKLIGSNDNWRSDPGAGNIESYGLAPSDDAESALAIPVPAGNNTVIVRGAQGGSGLALVEVYDVAGRGYQSNMLNLSTRGLVQTGDKIMIAGLILEDQAEPTRIVARALGPSLAAAGIANPLPDPTLELRNEQGSLIASNDNWSQGNGDDLRAVGLAPGNDNEAAIFTRLPSGAYTAIVRGKNNGTGVALVEWYNLH